MTEPLSEEQIYLIEEMVERLHFQDAHKTITHDRVARAVERRMTTLDNPGFCLHCGADADGCEPDARMYSCEACGRSTVYGADHIIMYFTNEGELVHD